MSLEPRCSGRLVLGQRRAKGLKRTWAIGGEGLVCEALSNDSAIIRSLRIQSPFTLPSTSTLQPISGGHARWRADLWYSPKNSAISSGLRRWRRVAVRLFMAAGVSGIPGPATRCTSADSYPTPTVSRTRLDPSVLELLLT